MTSGSAINRVNAPGGPMNSYSTAGEDLSTLCFFDLELFEATEVREAHAKGTVNSENNMMNECCGYLR